MLQIEEITNLEEFEKVGDQWRALQAGSGARSIFLSHDWFLTCARCLSASQQILILLVRRDGLLVGAAPLVQERVQIRRLPARRIGFLGNAVSPFVDFLFAEPKEGMRSVVTHLRQSPAKWDLVSLAKLREDSPYLSEMEQALCEGGQTVRVTTVSRTPYLFMNGKWDDFYQSTSQKFKKTRRSVANRVERLGPSSVELLSEPSEASRGVEEMLTLSERGWLRKQGRDPLSREFEKTFFRGLTSVASRNGWLRLWLLRQGERVLASEYHLNDHGTEYGLRAHYDEAFSSVSPGAYLDTQIVRRLFEGGCALYDMGPGAAEYKLAWTDSMYHCCQVDSFNRGLYSQFLGKLETQWIPAAKASGLGQRLLRGWARPSNS